MTLETYVREAAAQLCEPPVMLNRAFPSRGTALVDLSPAASCLRASLTHHVEATRLPPESSMPTNLTPRVARPGPRTSYVAAMRADVEFRGASCEAEVAPWARRAEFGTKIGEHNVRKGE